MIEDKILLTKEWAYMHLPKCKYKLQFKMVWFFEAIYKFGFSVF